MVQEICLICHRPTEVGLRIFAALLCPQCEKELLQTKVGDPRYNVYVDRLRTALPAAHEILQP